MKFLAVTLIFLASAVFAAPDEALLTKPKGLVDWKSLLAKLSE